MDYTEQHKKRLSAMPWLYYRLKPKHLTWARPWQEDIQQTLMALETVTIGKNVFIAPSAQIFAEPGRDIIIGDNSYIAGDATLHGPIRIGSHVSINHHATLDGGSAGIDIADHCRLAAYSHLYAFNHGLAAGRPICEQPVTSQGIRLERDVWLGSHCGVTDGVTLHEGAVAGMSCVVTRDVAPYTIVAGNPARPIDQREA
ncbi:acyltransferase [Gilvimarinus agarilyticus]|uniref:acyltransferase n=1 Tax=Gilvimarinus sp. 2_MG-2023 TaxID=3062666 RepID=UPI001C08CD2B|nr:acyltransferase [Gilvimarinus sp. 2_MG-2023]MBU2885049.1 acyltransferase [Gilvimarinus agarilyticus]MDO6569946.1 acyltransferase [Gilvimarinus sp. 2_MG-2023]